MRVFYSDYGTDPDRIARIEGFLARLKARGAAVCRTSRAPLDTVALNLPLPRTIVAPPAFSSGTPRHTPDRSDSLLTIAATCFNYDYHLKTLEECAASILQYQSYIHFEIDNFQPSCVILWHQFNHYHYIVADYCKARDIPVIYAENGVLPGSWCFEHGGQMAESWIAGNPDGFAALPVSAQDRADARRYLDMAARSKLNRKTGGPGVREAGLAEALADDPRPTILYAGVNDIKTGLAPYSWRRSPRHAIDYASSEAGLDALLEVAGRRDWRILYKPHPGVKPGRGRAYANDPHLLVIEKSVDLVDLLRHVDVLATILSQSAYMALINGVPCVLMGRMQLTGSGLAHEALRETELEAAVEAALADSGGDRAALEAHVARLLRHYLVAPTMKPTPPFRYGLADVADAVLAGPLRGRGGLGGLASRLLRWV